MSENQPTSQGKLNTYRMLLPLLTEQRLLIIGWLFFLAISSAATLTLPAAARFMIDRGFGQTDPQLLNAGFMGLFVVAMVMAAAGALRYFCITLLGERVAAKLRTRLYALLSAPVPANWFRDWRRIPNSCRPSWVPLCRCHCAACSCWSVPP